MLAWIFAVVLLPGIGIICFLAIGTPRLERTKRKRRRRRQRLAVSLSQRPPLDSLHATRLVERLAPATRHLMKLATRVTAHPPTHSNRVTIYPNEEQSLYALRDLIASARSHVHLEYYIFRPDETGTMIRDALIARARDGVEVRVLVDYLGSWSLKRAFTAPMLEAGVQFDYFLPVVPWQGPWRINFRNHRKILIIDGRLAFTGSHNIGNEYRGRHPSLGIWQDTNLSIEGPAVQQFQEIFVEDWYYTTGHELVSRTYFPDPEPVGSHIVQVIASGPDTDANPILDVVFAAIAAARRSICILTPYFVPDEPLLQALQVAAYGGATDAVSMPS
jgi:cardiolipin synthase